MAASETPPVLIADDTNVLLDLAEEVEDVTDAMLAIRRRLPQSELLMLPTVREELAAEALDAEDFQEKARARIAFGLARTWRIQPIDLVGRRFETARRVSRRLRHAGLLPEEEINDGLIIAEAAELECSMLITSDEHLRGIDFQRLTFELQAFALAAPVVATPREIARKFFR